MEKEIDKTTATAVNKKIKNNSQIWNISSPILYNFDVVFAILLLMLIGENVQKIS